MTNLEALKSTAVGYPVGENTFLKILIDRELAADAEYPGKTRETELAQADLYVALLTGANIQEGGFQVSMTDKSNFFKVASGIYDKWGEPNPLNSQPTIQSVNPW